MSRAGSHGSSPPFWSPVSPLTLHSSQVKGSTTSGLEVGESCSPSFVGRMMEKSLSLLLSPECGDLYSWASSLYLNMFFRTDTPIPGCEF